MTCPAEVLANKIEVHLKLDETPGYYLSTEDQQMIIECLRFASRSKSESCGTCGKIIITDSVCRP